MSYLEQQLGRSKEFLSKVRFLLYQNLSRVKLSCLIFFIQAVKVGDSTWGQSTDEEIFANLGGQHMWEENYT